jgi:hypothetical protein
MSSKTSTSGCSSASRCAHSRPAQAISCWLRSACTASSTPGGEAQQVGDDLVLAEFAQLLDRDVERVVVDDPGCALHHLGERPVGDALAVRQAAAGENGGALERLAELVREAALADAGLAVDREQVRAAVAQRPVVGVLQQLELGVAADQRRLQGLRALGRGAGAEDAPRPHLVAEALQRDRPHVFGLDAAEREPMGGRADQQLAGLRRLLEPRRDGHRLTGREGRVRVVRDDFAGLHADARFELELAHFAEDRKARANRPLGVVLVRLRDAERGHHGVAGELLDDPAVRGHAPGDPLEVVLDTAAHDLRIRARNEPSRIHEVHEQNRGQLAFHASSVETTEAPRPFRPSSIRRRCSTPEFSRPTTCAGFTAASSTRRARRRSGAPSWRSSSRSASPSGTTCASRRLQWPRR